MLSAGNARHVQRIVVTECSGEVALEALADTEGAHCQAPEMQGVLRACVHTVVAWARGSKVRI